ncbi:MAG: histidine--tRNA ligase [Coprothermobacterota bacterium]|nr:histidine--tRNA ligase [Coprothermobacterota bacterium]
MEALNAPRGTQDILPPDSALWVELEGIIRRVARSFVYEEIRTPLFEHSELFQRGVGSETDIVCKEMYTFADRGGRSLTLRPEGTAAVARAYLQHNLANRGLPQKLLYLGPMFRYERPQAGRFRQHHQFGFEVLGAGCALVDVEVITVAIAVYRTLGIQRFTVLLNSIGCRSCRPVYLALLRESMTPHLDKLCPDCQRRHAGNPLRLLDCKNPSCQPFLDQAPHSADHLCPDCRSHFQEVQRLLSLVALPFQLEPRLVRGLDYYTRTVFEVTSPDLGAQNALCGGGRYDDLVATLGGSPTPGVGFAGGLERALLILVERGAANLTPLDVYLVHLGPEAQERALLLSQELRQAGLAVDQSYDARSLSSQLKIANRKSARYTVIIGENELRRGVAMVREMALGQQTEVALSSLLAHLRTRG